MIRTLTAIFLSGFALFGAAQAEQAQDSGAKHSLPQIINPSSGPVKAASVPLTPNSNIIIYLNQAPSGAVKPSADSNGQSIPPVTNDNISNMRKREVILPNQQSAKVIKFDPVESLDLNVSHGYKNDPDVKRLFRYLHLKKVHTIVHFLDSHTLGRYALEDNIVSVRPRSYMSMMDYLSNSVQVSQEVMKQRLVLSHKLKDGKFFDLTNLTKGILLIHSSRNRPHDNVNVEVFYRNHWFYIADNDISSKRTMALMEQIFGILAGSKAYETPKPVLTIPIR